MILYFSATGNCKYAAARIAAAMGQDTVSIVDCIQRGEYSFSDDSIGIVSPTYFWGLPSIVKEFLEKAAFNTDYLYFVSTYGTTPGASGMRQDKLFMVELSTLFTPCACPIHGLLSSIFLHRKRRRYLPKPRRRRSTA